MRRGSTMPPAQPRCAGCNSPAVELKYRCGDRYRCRSCTKAKALWQCCALAWCKSPPACCVPLPALLGRDPSTAQAAAVGVLACPACVFAHECTISAKPSGAHVLEGTRNPAAAMSAVHLMVAMYIHVEVWIIPYRDKCLLYWVRVILWRCWGVFAGVLRGPRYTAAACRRPLLEGHVAALKAAKDWPKGDAPIVFTGTVESDLPRTLKPKDEARVRTFRKSLSRQHAAAGMRWELLNLDPAAAANTNGALIKAAAEFLRSLGIEPDTANARPWDADTPEERAFRRSLHTSKAAAFRWP